MAEWWGKLTAADAHALADVIATFPRSKVGPWSRMLLTLFSTSRDGEVSMGARTLANQCDVSYRAARYFVERMEADGVLVPVGRKKNGGGEFAVRRFEWADGVRQKRGENGAPMRQKNGAPCAKNSSDFGAPLRQNSGDFGAHKSMQSIQNRTGAGSPGGDQPPSRQTEWPEIPPAIAAWHKAHADEIRAGWL